MYVQENKQNKQINHTINCVPNQNQRFHESTFSGSIVQIPNKAVKSHFEK